MRSVKNLSVLRQQRHASQAGAETNQSQPKTLKVSCSPRYEISPVNSSFQLPIQMSLFTTMIRTQGPIRNEARHLFIPVRVWDGPGLLPSECDGELRRLTLVLNNSFEQHRKRVCPPMGTMSSIFCYGQNRSERFSLQSASAFRFHSSQARWNLSASRDSCEIRASSGSRKVTGPPRAIAWAWSCAFSTR